VPQGVHLFDISLWDNIRPGRRDATNAEVERAARAACIHDAILTFPGGYGSPAGEHGGHLSGGSASASA
jgi:ABC-type multidrug transport system fused ATPase/permease subunit